MSVFDFSRFMIYRHCVKQYNMYRGTQVHRLSCLTRCWFSATRQHGASRCTLTVSLVRYYTTVVPKLIIRPCV